MTAATAEPAGDIFGPPIVPVPTADSCVAQGAEARVWRGTFLDRPTIFKQRFSKAYRHPVLNARLTSARVKAEARALARARRLGVPTPAVLFVDTRASTLYLEHVDGPTLREVLKGADASTERVAGLMADVGRHVAALHDGGLVHGDLTTSNLLVRARATPHGGGGDEVVVIDFGLATNSGTAEDKAVDLFVLERALTAAHATSSGGGGGGGGGGGAGDKPAPKHGPAAHCPDALFAAVLASYRHHSRSWRTTLAKFAEVRLRGRKRSMVG